MKIDIHAKALNDKLDKMAKLQEIYYRKLLTAGFTAEQAFILLRENSKINGIIGE